MQGEANLEAAIRRKKIFSFFILRRAIQSQTLTLKISAFKKFKTNQFFIHRQKHKVVSVINGWVGGGELGEW